MVSEIKIVIHSVDEVLEDKISGSSHMWDLADFIKSNELPYTEILEITSIFVSKEFRGKGVASNILSDLTKAFTNKVIYLQSGAHVYEYDEEPDEEEIEKCLVSLHKFYTSNGFLNVNRVIGHYSTKCSYLFDNEFSKPLLKKIEQERIALDGKYDFVPTNKFNVVKK